MSANPKNLLFALRSLCIVAALVYAWPLAWNAYERLIEVNQQARARLIEEHRLWELQPDFRGKPETWTRVAARLLNDGQLLARVALKYGSGSEQVELDYRRDLAIARAEVVLTRLAIWAVPLIALYGLVLLAVRRETAPSQGGRMQPSSLSDPRYRPPQQRA